MWRGPAATVHFNILSNPPNMLAWVNPPIFINARISKAPGHTTPPQEMHFNVTWPDIHLRRTFQHFAANGIALRWWTFLDGIAQQKVRAAQNCGCRQQAVLDKDFKIGQQQSLREREGQVAKQALHSFPSNNQLQSGIIWKTSKLPSSEWCISRYQTLKGA